MAEPEDGNFVGCKSFDNVVDGDIGWAADQDSLVSFDHLQNELYQSVCFASLVQVSLCHSNMLPLDVILPPAVHESEQFLSKPMQI